MIVRLRDKKLLGESVAHSKVLGQFGNSQASLTAVEAMSPT